MRFALTLTATLLASTAALANDILIRADISEATVFLSGANITRRATVTMPPGDHRLLIAMPDAGQADLIEVTGPGGERLGTPHWISGHVIAEGALDDPAQAAARAAVLAAEDAVQRAQDDLAAADTALRALEVQNDYLAALGRGGPDGAVMPADPGQIAQTLATLGAETARIETALLTARIARRRQVDALADRQDALNAARADLARLRPFGTTIDVIEVSLRAEAETVLPLALDYLSYGAGWEPAYELRLDSDDGTLAVDRFISVYTSGAARWENVTMTFSTGQPNRQRGPSTLSPTPARIMDQPPSLAMPEARLGDILPSAMLDGAEPAPLAEVQVNGLSVSYPYSDPVSIGPGGEAVLPLDTLDLTAETQARAVPRLDQTAFLVAMARNDSGTPILPGPARFYRDGALIGDDVLPLIAAGARADFAFGPLDHLRLVWIDRSLAEGDRGLFTTTNTQMRDIAFGVENTGDSAEPVRVLYATPFAEQDDLDLTLTLSPSPDARDIDDLRGVQAWDLTVAPGQTALIEMQVDFDWPDGQILTWRP